MKLDNYFLKNKEESPQKIDKIFRELNDNVIKYVADNKRPILDGKIDFYNNLIANKHLTTNPKEISEVLEDFSKMFQRTVVWENAGTMINITPPANIVSIVTAYYTSLFNPNLLT